MRTAIEIIVPGTVVYAISAYKNLQPEDEGKRYSFIEKAIVRTAYYDLNSKTQKPEITYWLSTLNGEDWGDSVNAEDISEDIEDLVEVLKKEWLSYCK